MNGLIKKIMVSALLLTTFNDFIQGTVTDLFAPLLNAIIPGDISKPIKIGSVQLFLTRYIIRLINVYVALLLVFKLNTGYFTFWPFKKDTNLLV